MKINVGIPFFIFSSLILASCSHSPFANKQQVRSAEEAKPLSGSPGAEQQGYQGSPSQTRPANTIITGGYQIEEIPGRRGDGLYLNQGDGKSYPAPRTKTKFIDTHIKPLTIPQFLDYVFGETLLDIPFVTGPSVSSMKETIQLRTDKKMSGSEFQDLVIENLGDYGLQFIPEKKGYRIVMASELRNQTPGFIYSRANQRTPEALQPYLEYVPLNYVDPGSMKAVLDQAFSLQRDKITIKGDAGKGAIALSGLGEYVNQAYAIIKQYDQRHFAGGQLVKYSPRYWNVGEFSKALVQSLSIEGWQATDQLTLKRPIIIYPLKTSNDVFVFIKTEKQEEAKAAVLSWIGKIDQPLKGGDAKSFHIYQVKNTNAELLAETVNSVLSGQSSSLLSPQPGLPSASGNSPRKSQSSGLTVDAPGNRIIFVGTQSEYADLEDILSQLDTPAPEVLIEVLIAEVSLTDEKSTGVEFFVDDIGDENYSAFAGTGGLGLGTSGFNIGFLSGNVTADINAFASNRDVKLLSKPSLVARSGGIAEIQIGQDIPVITAQRASNNQDGIGPLDILQSIEYRKIGNLLAIEPIVFSNDRIDLTITQEVSSTVSVSNSTISSPTISNRSISTQLSLEDGQTAVLGGLIQEDYVKDDKGIPILKDIPGIGEIFSTKGDSVIQTDLVLLITAYVLRGQADRKYHVERLQKFRVDKILDQNIDLPFICLRDRFYSADNRVQANANCIEQIP